MRHPKFLVVGLRRGSNPSPSSPLFDSTVDGERRVHCRRYGNCLSFAASQDWNAWSCKACPVDEVLSRDEWVHDLEGLARLIRAIVG